MRIKLAYPKIPDGKDCPLKRCVAFEKLDGTNLHWVWEKDKVWTAFGTRRDQFPYVLGEFAAAHPELEEAPETFVGMASALDRQLMQLGAERAICFTEFYGKHSFAGQHHKSDEKYIYLIDVMIDDKLLSPEDFLTYFGEFGPKVVYRGKYTGQFVEDVRAGKYKVNEGVVCKGVVDGSVYMTKIKTNAYMERLKVAFKDNWKEYWE